MIDKTGMKILLQEDIQERKDLINYYYKQAKEGIEDLKEYYINHLEYHRKVLKDLEEMLEAYK